MNVESIEKLRKLTICDKGEKYTAYLDAGDIADAIEREIAEKYTLLPVDAGDEPVSGYEFRQSINLSEIADEYAKRLQEHVDELALDMAAETLAKYGYVKVVRCRDCRHYHEGMCMLSDGMGDFKRWYVDADGFCSDGEREVGA